MKTIHLHFTNLNETFRELSKAFNTEVQLLDGYHTIEFNNDYGYGTIKSTSVGQSVCYSEFQLNLKEVVNFKMHLNKNCTLADYATEGPEIYSETIEKQQLKECRTNILCANEPIVRSIVVAPNTDYKFSTISVSDCDIVDSIYNKFNSLFQPKPLESLFTYTSSYNVKIAELIEVINETKYSDSINTLILHSNINSLLIEIIKQHQDDLKEPHNHFGTLTVRELKIVKETADGIKSNPEVQYSVSGLCCDFGLSAAKMQEGFKFLYNSTVNEYIRIMRLDMAEKLIVKNELNISEIVYSVGLTSRSYFSKIFKERYDCSPRFYQEQHLSSSYSA